MPGVSERNAHVKQILNGYYNSAVNPRFRADEGQYKNQLDILFGTTAWGFREILLVVIVGMKLDAEFRASTGLYDCNPRAIYEGPIKEFLIEKNIPHRKSGPLNVAKATVGLDHAWAAQRRPAEVAEQVVTLVNALERDRAFIDRLAVILLRRLVNEATRVSELTVEIAPTDDPVHLYQLCRDLIIEAPDAGNTPQKIAAFLLKNYHAGLGTGVVVTGEEDRASVTSTTSKKPGDVNEESADGEIFKVYEVTVKPFDLPRIRDSYDCVNRYNEANGTGLKEIIVICRGQDCPDSMQVSGLHSYMGSYSYQDIMYYFWDIFEWVSGVLQRMNLIGKEGFYQDLNNYINDFNTSEQVKRVWRRLHT